ncbi:MAG: hypothetical protein QMD71_06000 [bacterium]|nr:hypothetical protein [bacterium]
MSILNSLKRAFAIKEEDTKLTSDESELLKKIAKGIVDKRLTVPAITFLESVKYLNFIGSQVLLFFEPIVQSILPTQVYGRIQKVLEKRESVEYLIQAIEKLEK